METIKNRGLRGPVIFYIYYFIFYSGSAIQGSFLTLFLTESGIPVDTLGLINGTIQILSLFVFPMFGRIADRAPTKNRVHCALLSCSIAVLFLMTGIRKVVLLSIFRILFAVFYSPITSIEEAITLEYCSRNSWDYTNVYMWGSVGYTVMSFLSGYLLKDNIRMLIPLLIAVYFVTLATAALLPRSTRASRVVASSSSGSDMKRVLSILKSKPVAIMMMIYFINMFSGSINGTYFANHLRQLGGSYREIGIANALLSLSEMPFYFGPGKRWLEKMGVERSMLLLLAAGSVRWTICSMTEDPVVLMFTMAINGIQLVPVAIGLNQYLYDHAPADLKATAQSTLRHTISLVAILLSDFAGSGLHRVFSSAGLHPIKTLYTCLVPLNLIGLIIAVFSMRHTGKRT